jgi:large subunit ribosomal protein L10
MALTRAKKEQLIAQYEEGMASAEHAFLLSYQGLDVNRDTELRSRVRGTGARYEVVKNTLALLAIQGKPLGELVDAFTGPIAVAYTDDDVVSLAKVLTEFAKDAPVLQFRGGVVSGQKVAAEQIDEIAKLPSREDLIAKLLFLLQSPITRLARTLNAVTRDFAVVLAQVAEKKASAD